MFELTGVIIAVILVMILLFHKKSLWLVMSIGTLIVALFARVPWQEGLEVLHSAVISAATLNLLIVIAGIGILGELMFHSGGIEKILNALKGLIRDSRILAVILPGLIGLMAIPGGAFFSSPLVKEVGDSIRLTPGRMALANIYFRHIFYFVFPLFPGFIAMVELTPITQRELAMFNALPLAAALPLGFWFIFRHAEKNQGESSDKLSFRQNLAGLLFNILPLLIPVSVYLILGWPFWIGLLAGVVVALFQHLPMESRNPELRHRLMKLPRAVPLKILAGILGIMTFKEFIVYSGALTYVSALADQAGVPIELIFLFLPLITGIVTGSSLAALAIVIPVILPLLHSVSNITPMLALVYLSTLWGYIISPVHLCQLLTVEYFKVPLKETMIHLIWMGAVSLALSAAFFLLL